MSPFDFFKVKTCLSLHDAEYQLACAEFARVGLSDVRKFQALPIDTDLILGPHQSFNGSTNRILREFYESGAESLLFLEDDCLFKDLSHLGEALAELPPEWDMAYLGANIQQPDPTPYSKHLWRLPSAWTTHAVGYNRKVVPWILENQPGWSETMFDCWLSTVQAGLQCYIVAPMVAYQRPRHSSIWGRYDDYTPIFEASDARLR